MNRPFRTTLLFFALLSMSTAGSAARRPLPSRRSGALQQFTLAEFGGSGRNSIQAVATDSRGNIYAAGTTSSPDFPVKNAAQAEFGESRIMRTADLGVTWTRVGSPSRDVNVVVPDPVVPQVLFAGGDEGIYKSRDGGANWTLIYAFQSVYSFSGGLAIDAGNHLRLAAMLPFSGKLIRSVDGGETWTEGGPPCPVSNCQGQLLADPTGSGALLVNAFGLYLSRDWGTTFQPLNPSGVGGPSVAAFDPSHRGWIYAGSSAGVMGSLALSTDFGATWIGKASPPTVFSAIQHLIVDPDRPNTLVAATPDGLYKSRDGAASWTRQSGFGAAFLPESQLPIAFPGSGCAPAGGLFALGSAAAGSFQVAFSPDYGATWKTAQLTGVTGLTAAAGCAVYVTRTASTDAFVAKLAPDGSVLWATYLGGSDQDAPVGMAVDNQDNVYVTGNTTSPDFPATVPRIGVAGQSAVFVVKLSPDGRLEYSVVAGGESRNTAVAITVDGNRNAYVAGGTNSAEFPVTPGAFGTKLAAGSYTGFLLKLTPEASLVYATYLGESYAYAGAILVDAGEEVIIAGTGLQAGSGVTTPGSAFVLRLDRTASRVSAATQLPWLGSSSALVEDAQGNLFVAGQTGGVDWVTPGAYVAPPPLVPCTAYYYTGGEVYVGKLAAADWKPVYGAVLRATCGIQPGALVVDQAGAAILAMATGSGLPLRKPLLAGPACGTNSGAVARLSPSGSALEFATYLDYCGIPGIALAADGSLLAGVSPLTSDASAEVLGFTTTGNPAVSLDGIANAFSGDTSAVALGGLYALTGSGFQAPAIDLGLNAGRDLPTTLGGLEVRFDGVPAAIVQTGQGRVIVVAPAPCSAQERARTTVPGLTAVQVVAQGLVSNMVWMPVTAALPGLLTPAFLNPQPPADSDGYVHNDDGTLNDAAHPAAVGSMVTFYVTGMGATNPQVIPGSIAHSTGVVPVTAVYTSWKRYSYPNPPGPEIVYSLPGYLSALFQIPVKVPAVAPSNGTGVGAGDVQRVLVGLQFALSFSSSIPPASNMVGVYVK